MAKATRIYTRAGDNGQTALVGGDRVQKNDARIEAYGTVDELNAVVGLVRERNRATDTDAAARDRLEAILERVQHTLFNLGASLATPAEKRSASQPSVSNEEITWLESLMDEWNAELPVLKTFVLPGGGPVGSMLHLARTVCRRAERRILTLVDDDDSARRELAYVNRLSDMLFVMGRWAALKHGETETLWSY